MSEERKMILKMLEEGKINSEEAAKLLEALNENDEPNFEKSNSNNYSKSKNFQDEIHKFRDRLNDWKKDFKSSYNQKDFDKIVDDFNNKAENFGKNIASTTVNIVDRMVDFVGSFVDTNTFNSFSGYNAKIKKLNFPYSENLTLDVIGINGSIIVKTHADDEIKINSKIRSSNASENIVVLEENGDEKKVKFDNPENLSLSISHEVFIPEKKIKNLTISTTNGKIYIEDVKSELIETTTSNSNIELMGTNSEKLNLSTKNAKLQISYVISKKINIDANNALIDIKHLKTEAINAITANGRINLENVQNYEDSNNINISFRTKNGNIKVNMNDTIDRGYKVKANTTLNGINLLIPKLKYKTLNPNNISGNMVEAETEDYSLSKSRVFIQAETKNGYIEIVK